LNLVAVSVVKDEDPYLLEWREFHRLGGVELFVLYDTGSTNNGMLEEMGASTDTLVLSWRGSQIAAYREAILLLARRAKWMMFIDIDEFVFAPSDGLITTALKHLDNHEMVLLPWRIFGTSGIEHRDAKRPVIADFTQMIDYSRPAVPKRAVKTKAIVRPELVARTHVHRPVMRGGDLGVWSDGYPSRDLNHRYAPDARILLNHYVSKSKSEFHAKTTRNESASPGLWNPPVPGQNDEIVRLADQHGVCDRAALDWLKGQGIEDWESHVTGSDDLTAGDKSRGLLPPE
jgi:hypothetical protein